jgi:hypothetical protein
VPGERHRDKGCSEHANEIAEEGGPLPASDRSTPSRGTTWPAREMFGFDQDRGFLVQLRAGPFLQPGLKALGSLAAAIVALAIFLGGWLAIHPSVARGFGLGGLNSDRPFAMRLVHSRLDLREDHFGDG